MNDSNFKCTDINSQAILQFIPLKNIGVSEGTECTTKICLENIKIETENFTSVSLQIPAGEIKVLNVDNISNHGKQEKLISSAGADLIDGIVQYDIKDKDNVLISSIIWDKTGLSDSAAYSVLLTLFEASAAKEFISISGSSKLVYFTGITDGYEFNVDAFHATVLAPTTVVYVSERYPLGGLRFIVLTIDWDDDIDKNKQQIQFMTEKDYLNNSTIWTPIHQMLLLTGGFDTQKDDFNMLGTIYLRNQNFFNVSVSGMVGA